MSKLSMDAKAWLRSNDPDRSFSAKRFRKRTANRRGKIAPDCAGLEAASVEAKRIAEELLPDGRRLKAPLTGLRFLVKNRRHAGEACLLMPFSVEGVRAAVSHRGKSAPASRVMCIIAHGEPPTPGHVARHLCGNGHLSCVNPAHLAWGTPEQNVQDDAAHRGLRYDRPIVRVMAAKTAGGGV